MDKKPEPRSGIAELFFGVAFLVLGVFDLVRGNLYFGIGFVLLGVAVALSTALIQRALGQEDNGPFTWLRIVAYVLVLGALVVFVMQVAGHGI